MKIICDCGAELDTFEDGVNGSLYVECSKCNKYGYNIQQSELEDYEPIEGIDFETD